MLFIFTLTFSKVIMGGGRQEFFPHGYTDPEHGRNTHGRQDNLNLVNVSMISISLSLFISLSMSFSVCICLSLSLFLFKKNLIFKSLPSN